MAGAFVWVVPGFIVVALALLVLRPAERMRIRTAILLFTLSFVGLLVIGALLS